MAARMQQVESFQVVMQFVVLPMFFLSGAMFPLTGLPRWLAVLTRLDPLSYAALRIADESSRGLGIWLGCVRARDFRALLPRRPPPPDRR